MAGVMKYKFIYQRWWKVIALLLMLYTFIVGYHRPLRPGIIYVSDTVMQAGQNYNIDIQTYNAHFTDEASRLQAFLRLSDEHVLRVPYVTVTDRNHVNIKGALPAGLPKGEDMTNATLVLQDEVDGFILYPGGLVIQSDSPGKSLAAGAWSDEIAPMEPSSSFKFPFVGNLNETIRNTFFHVAIWMAMFVLLVVSLIYSIRYLRSSDLTHDAIASSFTEVAMVLGMVGMITGSFWAKATWGTYWTNDPKLNMAAVAVMIYLAYLILRASITQQDQRAKIASAYNIFAFVAMIPLIFIIPRMNDSMHPGNGGNPALGGEDLDSTLRMVFYPAIIAYTLMGVWLSSMIFRIKRIGLLRSKRLLNKLSS